MCLYSQALSGFYTKYVEQGAPNSWPVKLWAGLSQNTILKEKLIEFFDSQTDFSKRLTSWKANSKVLHIIIIYFLCLQYLPVIPSPQPSFFRIHTSLYYSGYFSHVNLLPRIYLCVFRYYTSSLISSLVFLINCCYIHILVRKSS